MLRTDVLYRIRTSILKLNDFWRLKEIDKYVAEARFFVERYRDSIREEVGETPLSWDWIQSLDNLVVVHHRSRTSNEGVVQSDENLLLQLYDGYGSTRESRPAEYLFQKYRTSSNILKRRAFLFITE